MSQRFTYHIRPSATPFAQTHTFSAKEKDVETDLSVTSLRSVSSFSLCQVQTSLVWHSLMRRFGSRYYSSDLSIWLSVDPMSDKYPSVSPYAYCRNKPLVLVDPNGMFDNESQALRVRNRAAKKYGEDKVSDVFNKTIDGGKANYSFSIYGKGKTKYSRGGGTNEQGGPIITCDKPDRVISTGRDYRSYSNNSRLSIGASLTLTVGAQYGTQAEIKGQKIGLMGNIASVDLVAASLDFNKDGLSTETYLIDQAYTQGNSGFTVGPIGYNYYSETSFEQKTYSNHSLSVVGLGILNSNQRGHEISFSCSLSVLLGVRLDLKVKY